jgi:hypothetical protein
MVSAYVLVSVEAGKNQDVVSALRQVAGVTQSHARDARLTTAIERRHRFGARGRRHAQAAGH